MKPIRFDHFLKSVNKAFPLNGAATPSEPAAVSAAIEEKKNESFDYFRADRKMVNVMLDDILYTGSMKDYIKVNTVQGVIITQQSSVRQRPCCPKSYLLEPTARLSFPSTKCSPSPMNWLKWIKPTFPSASFSVMA